VHAAWLIYEAHELARYLSEAVAWSEPSGGMAFAINAVIFESFAVAMLLGAFSVMFWLWSWFTRSAKSRKPSFLQILGLVSCFPFFYILLRIPLSILGV